MVAFTLGEAATLALVRASRHARSGSIYRSNRPMRRDSVEAGSFEDMFFALPAKGECDRMLRAARDALDAGRRLKRAARAEGRILDRAEYAIASLTAGAVRVFEELCTLARLNRGRVYPSYDRLAVATALGRATVARSLQLLERAGFLIRQRRFVRIEGEEAGPRYAQTSNAYRPTQPAGLRRFLPRWRTATPIPDDVLQHAADQAEDVATMRAGISCRDLARTTLDGPLGRVLERLGAALDAKAERESQNHPEKLHNLIKEADRPDVDKAGPPMPPVQPYLRASAIHSKREQSHGKPELYGQGT